MSSCNRISVQQFLRQTKAVFTTFASNKQQMYHEYALTLSQSNAPFVIDLLFHRNYIYLVYYSYHGQHQRTNSDE